MIVAGKKNGDSHHNHSACAGKKGFGGNAIQQAKCRKSLLPDAKKTILRVDDKYIVCIKNEVLNGNNSMVIRKQKDLQKFTTLKHERN